MVITAAYSVETPQYQRNELEGVCLADGPRSATETS